SRGLLWGIGSLVLLGIGVAPGCSARVVEIDTCAHGTPDQADHLGQSDPCCVTPRCSQSSASGTAAGAGAGGAGVGSGGGAGGTGSGGDAGSGGNEGSPGDAIQGICMGVCVSNSPPGWSPPVLLWSGTNGEEPDCPAEAPMGTYRGYSEL